MGSLDESNQISEELESENATTNNGNEAIAHDETLQFGSYKKLISFISNSSSTSSDFSLEDLHVLDTEHDKSSLKLKADNQLATKHDENPNENSKHRISSHVFARTKSTSPGDWSMASNESLFSIHMDGTSFCRLESFSPVFNLPSDFQFVDLKILEMDEENNRGLNTLNEPTYNEDKENHVSATSSSSSNSFVFPILSGETEKGGSPNPRGSPIGPVPQLAPKPEPAPESRSNLLASGVNAETQKATTLIAWTKWFPCFRYCACCS